MPSLVAGLSRSRLDQQEIWKMAEFGEKCSLYEQSPYCRIYLLNFKLRIQHSDSQCKFLCQNI